jgi:nucleoside-diphosphate-sugar epimerase
MRVFVAGASGVIGRPLVRQLVEAGHDVTGMTSRDFGREPIRQAGGKAVVCDALDSAAVDEAVQAARPEVVISQLTRLPKEYALSQLRGATNAKAKRELGWQPRYPSWRTGFRQALG